MALIFLPAPLLTEPFWVWFNREDTQRLFLFTGKLAHDPTANFCAGAGGRMATVLQPNFEAGFEPLMCLLFHKIGD